MFLKIEKQFFLGSLERSEHPLCSSLSALFREVSMTIKGVHSHYSTAHRRETKRQEMTRGGDIHPFWTVGHKAELLGF